MNNPVLEVREKLGWSQEKMAREMKCSMNTVRLCEKEARFPKNQAILENFNALAARAKVEVPS